MSQRDRLLNRARPTALVHVRLDDRPDRDVAAHVALAEWEQAQLGGDGGDTEALSEFYETLTLQALPPAEFEEMRAAHPPEPEHAEAGWQWAPSFIPALIAACVVSADDDPLTADDWTLLATKGPLASGEIGKIFQAAYGVNDRSPDIFVGKGLRVARSS